ncbi:hypothetical protein [Mycolicibacterium baixiangningiae]|uniref:hypothetical protein n=1 Tax=Mycolicibacterium baixiangningiae TaxID=2761578 RepID=UPI001865F807|nr:hypothetical protein [Mycolicibacterium baixiangningiae]
MTSSPRFASLNAQLSSQTVEIALSEVEDFSGRRRAVPKRRVVFDDNEVGVTGQKVVGLLAFAVRRALTLVVGPRRFHAHVAQDCFG